MKAFPSNTLAAYINTLGVSCCQLRPLDMFCIVITALEEQMV